MLTTRPEIQMIEIKLLFTLGRIGVKLNHCMLGPGFLELISLFAWEREKQGLLATPQLLL